ncbi:uncharacterized protein FIBRA_02508 [Fibroporia radiculosa]|uniref:Uncharacterized protein n=1 Tax=Fibroporia radiculosa TaxID=599839 RepID=J4GMX4_9APHY|nr:uncharacterized protein FIBRA_02508 [Fibroporia radiculosa]CCM00475.1 predicted protein [Fibroporia radiculosa]
MPAPAAIYIVGAVSVIAAVFAFKEFVYEPHIAPRIEVWAESFVERRRRQRQQRHGPTLASPVNEGGNENRPRRSANPTGDHRPATPSDDLSVELNQFSVHQQTGRSDGQTSGGLRLRPTAAVMEESNLFIPFTPITPTRALSDSSISSSPRSPTHEPLPSGSPPTAELPPPYRPSAAAAPSPERPGASSTSSTYVYSPRRPTPLSPSAVSARATTPSLAHPKLTHSSPSSRASSPDVPAMYNTALMGSGSIAVERTPLGDVRSFPTSRIQSPFSDNYSIVARSPTFSARSDAPSSALHLEEEESELDMLSDMDTDEDVLSLRSEIFSPEQVGRRVLTSDVEFLYGSDTETESWASTGRRTPEM